MAAKRVMLTVEIDRATKAKLEWVAGREGKSVHGWSKALLLAALSKRPDPPAGFGLGRPAREHEED
jgi:hypothetical protein